MLWIIRMMLNFLLEYGTVVMVIDMIVSIIILSIFIAGVAQAIKNRRREVRKGVTAATSKKYN